MNKLLALFALATVASQLVVVVRADIKSATDDQEVAELPSKSVLFKDFCLTTRDYIMSDLAAKGKSYLVPTTVTDLLADTANTHRNIRERLQSIMNNPDAELAKLDKFVAEQQKALAQTIQDRPIQASAIYGQARDMGLQAHQMGMQARDRMRSFFREPTKYLQKVDGFLAQQQRAIGQKIQSTPIQPANFFKNAFTSALGNLQSMAARVRAAPKNLLIETCATFDQYQKEIEKRFAEAKKELSSQDPNVAELALSDVPCATMFRVNSVRSICAELRRE